MTIIGIIVGLLLVSIMMIIHEGGHFLMGKWLKFGIRAFNIFMGPKLLSKQHNKVEYNLRSLPIGASVEFYGEDTEDVPSDVANEALFYRRPRWARALVVFAGPAINILSAMLVLFIMINIWGITVPQINYVSDDGLASKKQVVVGDRLLSYNGYRIDTLVDLSTAQMLSQNKDNLEIEIGKADGSVQKLEFTGIKGKKSPLGIGFASSKQLSVATKQALIYPWSIVKSTVRGLGLIISGQLRARDGLAGPVGIISMVGSVVQEQQVDWTVKIYQLLMFFVFISVVLGFTNLLPIPPLDGHHLLILAIEGVLRRDLPARFKQILSLAGFALLIGLSVLVFYFDILRLVG